MSHARSNWLTAVLLAGLLAGTLDIAAAMLTSASKGVQPLVVLQSVASGLLGRDAYRGGVTTALLGLLQHFAIMQVIAALYAAATQQLAALSRRPFRFGALYGMAVYFFMKAVVLPLSAFPGKPSYALAALATGITVHVLCVGWPIALLLARRRA